MPSARSIINFILCFFLFISVTYAQWKEVSPNRSLTKVGKASATIKNGAVFAAEPEKLMLLKDLPVVENVMDVSKSMVIQIPLPNGGKFNARLFNIPLFHPLLQAKYPEILSFTGYGVDETNAVVKCDMSPSGFHAMILSPRCGTIFIDPLQESVAGNYVSYLKKDYDAESKKNFSCMVDKSFQPKKTKEKPESVTGDCVLRKYRLALACTGEYASFHGGTKPKVLAAMNTTMTRVSGVYERDFAVTFQIIANNDQIIFLNASSDPYSNNDGGTMLGQNQATIDGTIGSANYDIGHVFSTGGGGIASLYSVCNAGNKAQGVTGLGSPVGDPFDIDYVAHEMGHQFNANHTFNNDCGGNINPPTAFEPGSGTTIMAYAGVCDPNVQFNSDDHFHKISLDEISDYVSFEAGNTCPEKTNLDNTAPTVNAGKDQIIPKSTPFELTATATDIEGDSLTYCWEQTDNELVIHPPVNTYTNGPSFRSYKPTPSPTRVFPQIATIVGNSTSLWEVLPGVARKLNFTASVRDNHKGGGCFGMDNVKLTVNDAAGPFLVTVPNTPVQWIIGETQTISWNVANTEKAPINCNEVDIYLSTDGGFTYPVLLVSGIPNTGSYPVEVPNYPGTKNRIKVKAHNNVFFDISNTNFTIKIPTTPSYSSYLNTLKSDVCTQKDSMVSFVVSITPLAGFKDTIITSLDNFPPGAVVTVSPEKVVSPADVTITLSELQNVPSGSYKMDVSSISGNIIKKGNFTLNISNGVPEAVVINSIENNAKNISVNPSINWNPVPGAKLYHLVVAKDYLFNSIVFEADFTGTSAVIPDLDLYSVYFWNIHAINDCGKGVDSETRAFQTINKSCNTYTQNNVLTIPDNLEYQGSILLDVTDNFLISDLSVQIKAQHSFISDLKIDLQGPDDQIITLFGNSCDDLDDMDVTYSDKGGALVCMQNPPAISGIIKPASGELKQWTGSNITGTWKLNVTDIYPEDGGDIQPWSITACRQDSFFITPEIIRNNTLYVLEQNLEKIDSNLLLTKTTSPSSAGIRYFIIKSPAFGQIRKGNNVLNTGDSFTQADINQKLINYKNLVFGNGQDAFEFYVIDADNNWNPSQIFNIIIYKSLSAVITSSDLQCNGDSSGIISVLPQGGVAPYLLSADGGTTYQSGTNFLNLSAGEYTINIKDTIGNSYSQQITINEPQVLELAITKVDNTFDLNITGGTPPYQVSLDSINYSFETYFDSLANGLYYVYVKDDNNCIISDTVTIKGVSTADVFSEFIKIYPVPASEHLLVRLGDASPLQILLTNLMGKTVRKMDLGKASNGIAVFDIHDVQSGVYYLKLDFQSETIVKKAIIVH